MKIIVFRLVDDIYLGKELCEENTWILSGFLRDDAGPHEILFKDFIGNFNEQRCGGNFSWLEKDGDSVLIGCGWAENPYENYVIMPQKEFLSILNQWGQLIRQDPREIIMYKEGESYRLEGHGFPDKQE